MRAPLAIRLKREAAKLPLKECWEKPEADRTQTRLPVNGSLLSLPANGPVGPGRELRGAGGALPLIQCSTPLAAPRLPSARLAPGAGHYPGRLVPFGLGAR